MEKISFSTEASQTEIGTQQSQLQVREGRSMLSPGAIIGQGRYCITRELGKGTFGIVYLALDKHVNNREVAIKALNARIDDAETTAKFLHEVDIIAAFDHPNIVRLLDAGIEGNIPFFVMNYALHGTLRQHYPKGTQVPLQEVVFCVKQVAEALQYAHDQEIVHRDVKPENLLLGRNWEVLLSDFGIATVVSTTTTTEGPRYIDAAGTPLYMAPEQFNASPSRRSDQYSLAVIAYEWLCGKTPFVGSEYVHLAYQHLSVEPPSLCAQVPTLSHSVEHVILKALAKEREQRYPRVQDFAEALEKAATTLEPPGYYAQTTLCTYKEGNSRLTLCNTIVSTRGRSTAPASTKAAMVSPHSMIAFLQDGSDLHKERKVSNDGFARH